MVELIHKQITGSIIEAAIEVHKELGPGLLESAYEACLAHLLVKRGLHIDRQLELPVRFRDIQIDAGYRIDLLVEGKVVVELKAVKSIDPIHEAQLMTYLRLSGLRVGLLMNFNVTRMTDGIKRLAK